ncbi:MAG: alpha/beta hydrolase [Acidimicrobiia bacterium]|nr:alpha/beta hydrolase [Acidimicrobiia bacterium]
MHGRPAPQETEQSRASHPRASRGKGHIGRIVVGSITAGLVGAITLVAGPFAGAREHVITGSVLLTFALAWAALAFLSERRTDQPQRWAKAPAAFMAVAGATILAVAPTGNALGWVWPPALVALVIWMIARSRRALHSRTRAWVVYPVFATLLLSAIGGGYETYRETVDPSASPMPGRLISVGDHKLHINCTGTGSPTVVLEPGLGEPSPAMGWIAPKVTTTTRVCVYDRAGRGWSEASAEPRDGVETATDLHTLLARAGEQGPYVLAGHSAGGLYVLNYAHLYPDQVAGLVLLDSMHPDEATRIKSYSQFYEMFRRVSAALPSLSRLGVGRAIYATGYDGLPARSRDDERAFLSTPRDSRSLRDEFSVIKTAMHQAGALHTLGHRPLVVLTARKGAEPGWTALQNQLAALSTNRVHRVLANAEHSMLTEDERTAAHSSHAIRRVVLAVRTGTTLNRKVH